MTLDGLQLQRMPFQTVEDSGQSLTVFLERSRENEDVVKVDQTDVIRQTRQDKLHRPSELTWRIAEPEAEHLKSPLSFPCDERCLVCPLPGFLSANSLGRGPASYRISNH